jgi:hypothetical protein
VNRAILDALQEIRESGAVATEQRRLGRSSPSVATFISFCLGWVAMMDVKRGQNRLCKKST